MSTTITENSTAPNDTTGAIQYGTTWADAASASDDAETRRKLEERFPEKKVTKVIEVDLTAEQRALKGNELAALVQEIDVAKNHLKETAAGLRDEIKALEVKRTQLAQAIADGKAQVDVECIERLVFEQNAIQTVRIDTGEVIGERALSAAERQGELFDAAPVDGELDSPQELLDLANEADEDEDT